MTTPGHPRRGPGRTRIITAASIGAVTLAGLFALGANLGILTGSAESEVGKVSAAGDLVPADTRVVDVYVDAQGNPTTAPAAATAVTGAQRFVVGDAGTVDVSSNPAGPHIDAITPASGWSARQVPTSGSAIRVSFSDGTQTLDLTATTGLDGAVTGTVEAVAVPPVAPPTTRHDEEYEGGESDD